MSRYIDADVMRDEWLYESGTFEPNDVLDSIDCQPTVDAVKVVHGEWEHKPNTYICECTACRKYWIPDGDEYEYHYCPNCGAKMDRKENNDG